MIVRTCVLLTHTWAAVSPLDSGQRAESCMGAETVCVWHPQPHLFFSALHRLRRGHVQRSQLPGPGHLSCPAAADRYVHQDRDSGRSLSFSVLCLVLMGSFFARLQKRASEKQLQWRPGAGLTSGPRGNRQCQGKHWRNRFTSSQQKY